jgi:hypothetical protein
MTRVLSLLFLFVCASLADSGQRVRIILAPGGCANGQCGSVQVAPVLPTPPPPAPVVAGVPVVATVTCGGTDTTAVKVTVRQRRLLFRRR